MVKLLIVDDEPMFRDGLIHSIDWRSIGVEVAAQAYNGHEALRILEGMEIDIVLTDLRMPEMDGLELIERAASKFPRLRFIVLSAFDEFALVKRAFGLGIVDYLLKSEIREAELKEILIRQSTELQQGFEERERLAQQKNSLMIKHLLRSSAERKVSIEESDLLSNLFVRSGDGSICCAVMQLHPVDEETVDAVHRTRSAGLERAEELTDGLDGWITYRDGDKLVLFHFPAEPIAWNEFNYSVESLRSRIEAELNTALPGLRVSAGTGSLKRASVLGRPVAEAERACGLYFFRGIGKTCDYTRYSESLAGPLFNPDPVSREFTEHIRNRDIRGLKENIRTYLVEPHTCSSASREVILRLYTRYYYHLLTYSEQLNLTADEAVRKALQRFDLLQHIALPLESYNAWLTRLVDLLLCAAEGRNQLVNKVVRYLEENYMHELSLTQTAEYFQVNPSYLSRLFSRHSGKGFNAYITELRIARARDLLEEGNLRVYEVALQTGFRNPESFSRSFKKITGFSPSDYP